MERKKLMELLLSIFIALLFLSSYATFGGGATTTTTTTVGQQIATVLAIATGSASISSFGSSLNINISCSNATSVSNHLNALLIFYQKNGSVSNFYSQQASQILIQAGKSGSYVLYNSLSQSIGRNATCTSFSSQAIIQLPGTMSFRIPSQNRTNLVQIPTNLRVSSLPITFAPNMSSKMNVSVYALLTNSGGIYQNLTVKRAP